MVDVSTRNAILDKAIDYAFQTYPTLFAGFDRTIVQDAFANAMEQVFPDPVQLSTVSPDYESILLQLTNELSKNPVWYDHVTAATGQTLLRFVSAGIAYSQFSIERALQEAFGHLASADSSIYASAEMLGVRITRVVPATVTVQINRIDRATMVTLPKFTPFTIGELQFFNRDDIIFPIDINQVTAVLTQGVVYTQTFVGTGQPYQELEIGDGTRDLSDVDVFISVGGKQWQRSLDNPWLFAENEEKFGDATTPNGNINILFGNDLFGKAPPVNSKIVVTWVQTLGETANYPQAGLQVAYSGPSINDQIETVTVSAISGSRNMADAEYYARMAPYMRVASENAVRRQDYKRWAVEYPRVKDALFRGQAELGPNKRSMMNVIGVTLLTDSPFSNDEYNAFTAYMRELGIFQCEFRRMDPTEVRIDVVADVYCSPRASLEDVKTQLEQNLQSLFKFRLGWIGWQVYKSDIIDILEGVGELGSLVEYVDLIQPTNDIYLLNKASYIRLNSITLNMHYSSRENFTGRVDINLA